LWLKSISDLQKRMKKCSFVFFIALKLGKIRYSVKESFTVKFLTSEMMEIAVCLYMLVIILCLLDN